jgi:hypothetical protein
MNRTKESSAGSYRKTAILVGALFIIGTAAGVLSVVFSGSIFSDPDYLIKFAENRNQVLMASLCVLIMGLSLAMMSVVLFPVLKKYNEALALGAVVFRGALEAVLYIGIVICWLLLLTVSQEYVLAGAPMISQFQALGALLLKAVDQIGSILDIVFSLGALMIYYLFYRSKLIPGWLSVWGLLGAVLYLSSGLCAIFGVDAGFLEAPLALQEMVLAVWLIVRGFNMSPMTGDVRPVQAAIGQA